jgi:hypothetical protein
MRYPLEEVFRTEESLNSPLSVLRTSTISWSMSFDRWWRRDHPSLQSLFEGEFYAFPAD